MKACGLIPAHAGSTSQHCVARSFYGAHPRSRGEHSSFGMGTSRRLGSSPLTRGALRFPREVIDRVGLIPAHAGSTYVTGRRVFGSWAHPRSRGEHTLPPSR